MQSFMNVGRKRVTEGLHNPWIISHEIKKSYLSKAYLLHVVRVIMLDRNGGRYFTLKQFWEIPSV